MQTNFLAAINLIADEKNIPLQIVIETVEAALAAAYKKDYTDKDQEARAQLDEKTGEVHIFETKTVVPDGEVENAHLQIALSDAKKIDPQAQVREADPEAGIEPYTVEMEAYPEDFGRVAAQTAKQVIIQRLREAERDLIFTEYKDKEGIVLNGTIQRVEGNIAYVELGKAMGVLFASEQIPGERYYTGARIKVYVVRVEQTARGPQIVLSRAHANMVRHLFELEVPEIASGSVEIVAIAREAGVRSKVAVASLAPGVDPVGTFVGGRGSRVQAVMGDLGEEKIDIIPFSDDPKTFIANALSPTKVIGVTLDEASKKAVVRVPEDQLSLAIGKQGQNVRLAAKLTGWNIDILSAGADDEAPTEIAAQASGSDLENSVIAAVNAIPNQEEPIDPDMDEEITGPQADVLSGQESDDTPQPSL